MIEIEKTEDKKTDTVTTKVLWFDWLLYTVFCLNVLSPFFGSEMVKLFCLSLLVGAFFAILNRIARELNIIKNIMLRNKEK